MRTEACLTHYVYRLLLVFLFLQALNLNKVGMTDTWSMANWTTSSLSEFNKTSITSIAGMEINNLLYNSVQKVDNQKL